MLKFDYDMMNFSDRNALLKTCQIPVGLAAIKKHKIKLSPFHPKWWIIFQKVSGIVVVTQVWL